MADKPNWDRIEAQVRGCSDEEIVAHMRFLGYFIRPGGFRMQQLPKTQRLIALYEQILAERHPEVTH